MVKLTGPAVSTEAVGSIADVLSFQKGKRGTICKKHAKPAQPRTPKQVGVRACIKFLSQQWSTFTAAEMATWFTRARRMEVANYHAYISANANRFTNNLMPSKEDPATEAGGGSAMEANYVLPHFRAISYHAKSGGPPINWGYHLCRSQTSGFTPGPENTIAIFFKEVPVYTVYWDRDLAPGTYYYRCRGFDDTGRTIAWFGELFQTVL